MIEKAQGRSLVNVNLDVADNESLPYPESFYDRYMANLSLNIVPNPEVMLKEALRVLVPGGIAVFSVLGREEPTNLSTLVYKSCNTLGLTSPYRSIFYLNNDQNLRNLLKSVGFVNVLTFYTSSCFPLTSIQSALAVAQEMSAVREVKNTSYEKYNELQELLIEKISEVFNSGQLFTFDALIAVGEKMS
jgi:ubiquinone/menaquinone biosynthesis C-methylase UbiE